MLREYWLIPDVCNALLTFRLGSVKVTLHGFNMFCEVLDFLFMYILIEWQRERDKLSTGSFPHVPIVNLI